MKVHPEAVGALARWESNQDGNDWDTVTPDQEDHYLFHARRRLEAAAHIAAAHAMRGLASDIRFVGGSNYGADEIASIIEGRADTLEGK